MSDEETTAPVCQPRQSWTESGFPIVDGKYLDTSDGGKIKTVGPKDWVSAGPPDLGIYWDNRRRTPGLDDQFRGFVHNAFVSVTEYLSRIGEFLRASDGACKIVGLNATLYSVNLIVDTDMSQKEMMALMKSARVFPAE